MRCKHFFVTWEASFPRGCRAYGFKSAAVPAQYVKNVTGTPCQLFAPKPARRDPPTRR